MYWRSPMRFTNTFVRGNLTHFDGVTGGNAGADGDDQRNVENVQRDGMACGWAVGPEKITNAIRKVHDFLTVGAPAPLQEAGRPR